MNQRVNSGDTLCQGAVTLLTGNPEPSRGDTEGVTIRRAPPLVGEGMIWTAWEHAEAPVGPPNALLVGSVSNSRLRQCAAGKSPTQSRALAVGAKASSATERREVGGVSTLQLPS